MRFSFNSTAAAFGFVSLVFAEAALAQSIDPDDPHFFNEFTRDGVPVTELHEVPIPDVLSNYVQCANSVMPGMIPQADFERYIYRGPDSFGLPGSNSYGVYINKSIEGSWSNMRAVLEINDDQIHFLLSHQGYQYFDQAEYEVNWHFNHQGNVDRRMLRVMGYGPERHSSDEHVNWVLETGTAFEHAFTNCVEDAGGSLESNPTYDVNAAIDLMLAEPQ